LTQRLTECVRPADTVGRFGGDEFLVICEDLDHEGQGVEIAGRIIEGLARPFVTPFGERTLSVSIGVAPCSAGQSTSVVNLIRAADQAMYRAKMEGKARIVSALTRAPGPA
jgi:diguanylate cyclase (GGDEF)-like protein